MGIYIFKWSILKEYLEMDNRNDRSSHDFGKDIIPLLIEEKSGSLPIHLKDIGKMLGR